MNFQHENKIKLSYRFRLIGPGELYDLVWTRPDKELMAPNVVSLTRHYNRICSWVVSEIVAKILLPERISTLKHFIEIAYVRKFLEIFLKFFRKRMSIMIMKPLLPSLMHCCYHLLLG